ncbi:MAG: type II toxin-antitoxin system RelE/ParE family toxin [Sphingomonadales bacterium]|nr:type II toxin-antitoxin system RelE/ParE family toxin [Sphingomonadales bacterium]
MSGFRVSRRAGGRIDAIYAYTLEQWGDAQAERYVQGLFERFAAIAAREVPWRAVPAEFDVDGFMCRYERHFIYWKVLGDGAVGIVTVLHERMHQGERFRDDWGTGRSR